MEKTVQHRGKVLFVDGDRIDVEMTVESACGTCRMQKACGMDENSDKVVSLLTKSAQYYTAGEEVIIYIEQRMGIKAAAYAYMYPFFLMLLVLFGMVEAGFPETVAGLSSLGALVVYYLILWFFRKRIDKEIIFKLAKI